MKHLTVTPSRGGRNGPNYIVKLGDKYVGHFYADASDGIDADEVLDEIVRRFNACNTGATQ